MESHGCDHDEYVNHAGYFVAGFVLAVGIWSVYQLGVSLGQGQRDIQRIERELSRFGP